MPHIKSCGAQTAYDANINWQIYKENISTFWVFRKHFTLILYRYSLLISGRVCTDSSQRRLFQPVERIHTVLREDRTVHSGPVCYHGAAE